MWEQRHRNEKGAGVGIIGGEKESEQGLHLHQALSGRLAHALPYQRKRFCARSSAHQETVNLIK